MGQRNQHTTHEMSCGLASRGVESAPNWMNACYLQDIPTPDCRHYGKKRSLIGLQSTQRAQPQAQQDELLCLGAFCDETSIVSGVYLQVDRAARGGSAAVPCMLASKAF